MKKIVKFLSLLLVMLLSVSQMAWADASALPDYMAYFAKAKVQVGSKSNGMGTVYIGPAVQFAGAEDATSYDGSKTMLDERPFGFSKDGVPYIKDGYDLSESAGMMAMSPWFAPAGEDVKVFREIDFAGAGSALPVYAAYMAQPNQGYYFKGWSTIDNDASLGNQNPFAYPIQSQAMPLSAPVNEVMVYLNGEKMPMGYYVAEGNSNRYLYAQKTVYNDRYVYQCLKDGNDYALFDMSQDNSGVYLYIPQRDNVNQRIYVIDDDGTRVDQIDGGYLPVPSVSDASYIIMKNPYNGQFFTLHYDPTAVENCLNVANYPAEDYMYDLAEVPVEKWEGIITQRITDAIMECAANVLLSGQGSERLLVSFQRATYTIDGQEAPASAVVQARDEEDNLIYKAIQFLPDESTLPRIPTMYATFAPVQINGCTSQNIKTWSEENESKGKISFDVTFSTSYASKIEDFGEVTFDKQPTLGGTYSAEVTGFDSESGVVTVLVTFTGTSLADGEYKSSMTLSSYGGESYVSCFVNVRKGAEANKAVTIGDNKYDDLASALAAANAGDELVLLTNINIAGGVTLDKNITLNLDGWTLTGNVTVNSELTLKNGAIVGAVSVAQTGDLTVDGTQVSGTLTNNGTATLKRGTFDGGMAKSIVNNGMLTLEKGAEIIAEKNIGVDMTAGSDGVVNGARFRGNRPINLAEGANGNFNSAYFNYGFDFSSLGLIHYNVTVGAAYEAGYTHLYAKDLAAAQAAGAPVCKIGQTGYSSLEDALLYAQNNPSEQVTIIMTNDYTLKAGYYTLPANANLLIPYWEGQASIMGGSPQKLAIGEHYEDPEAFCTLTFANGVHMSVAGNIEASCRQFIAGHGSTGNAIPSGTFGWLKLEAGSDITLGNGSHLYAWGFVTGDGEIDARRGASVHEMFQVYDWPETAGALNMVLESLSGAGAFPVNQYFMQNVEAQTTFHPGARMFASFGASAAGLQVAADAIQIVGIDGDIAMFLMDPLADAENTWVRKRYDKENDIQVWEVNSGANLGSMVIEVPVFKIAAQMMPEYAPLAAGGFDSRNFILPITTNMKIHLLSGYMGITQNTELLPGAEIEVNKESTVTIFPSKDASSGFLYLFDSEDWKNGFSCDKPAQQIRYSPTFGGAPDIRAIENVEDLEDAKLNIHGTLAVEGLLMTTKHGANIFSNNEDAGTIVYPNKVSFKVVMVDEENQTTQVVESPQLPIAALPNQLFAEGAGFPLPHWNNNDKKTVRTPAGTAMLRNGVGEDAPSGGVTTNAESLASLMEDPTNWEPRTGDNFTMPGESFCYMGDRWTKVKQFDERFAYDNYNEWYIKPAEYVEVAFVADPEGKFAGISTQPLENDDHTYSDAAGEGRLFIWVESPSNGAPGQWWEVTLEDNLYKGKNGTFYEYNNERWVEHSFEITFLNWDGEPVLDHNDEATIYTLHYGDRIQYLGTNPTREENVDYTYNFTGWSPALNADSKVTGDATYMATFEAIQRKYTIIFLNENGTEIERHFLTRDEMPVCEDVPSKTGYYLQWSPAIGAVTGDQEYRATFTPEKPTSFMITFKNYDGTVIKSEEIAVDQTPACDEPSKPATSEYTYVFDRWNPAIEPVSQEMTYTAKFKEVPATYAIRFFDEEGVQIGETQNLAYGVAPVMPDYVKDADAEYTYTTTWKPVDAETGNVTAVTGDQDYEAVITPTKNKYTVTCIGEGCVFTGAGSYEHGTPVTLTLAAQTNYENAQWGDGTTGDKQISVTGDVTFTATATLSEEVSVPTYTIIFKDEDGNELTRMQKLLNTVPSCEYTKESTALYDYQITWSPAIQPVRRDMTYQAVVTAILHVDWNKVDEDITLTEPTIVSSFNIVAGEGVATTPQLFGAKYIEMMKGATVTFTYDFGTAQASTRTEAHWYAFAVPFKCDAETAQAADGATLRNTHEYDIIEYNGATRAAMGKNADCWEPVSGLLVPGKFYMIAFNRNQTTVTFIGKDNLTYFYDNTVSVEAHPGHVAGDDYGYGWNGIANPALYNANLSAEGIGYGQVYAYNNDGTGFFQVEVLSGSLPIATPLFVQTEKSQPVVVTAPTSLVVARRVQATDVERYELNLGKDRVFLVNDEMAEDEYVVGQDLAKFGISSKVAQVWVNRYGSKLCVNHQAPEAGETTYPLGIFVPAAGDYTLSMTTADTDNQVYLTRNGVPVANLSLSDYTLHLTGGTTSEYGIVIRKVTGNATDLNEAAESALVEKVLINGKVFILRDGKVFDVVGRLVK